MTRAQRVQKKRLIIVSDYGLDDACALAYLFNYAERFDGIDVVCAAGNVTEEQSLQNAQKLLHQFGSPSGVTAIHTLGFPQRFAQLPSVHGGDGMGDLFGSIEPAAQSADYNTWVKTLPASAIVLSLAPATVALDIVKKLKNPELVIMAGVVNDKPNYLGMEFNQALDSKSFDALIKFPHKIATLDTCRCPQFNLANRRFGGEQILNRLINRACELAEARHSDNAYIYDLIAALYVIEPALFAIRPATDPWGNELHELKLADGGFCLAEYLK